MRAGLKMARNGQPLVDILELFSAIKRLDRLGTWVYETMKEMDDKEKLGRPVGETWSWMRGSLNWM